MKKLTALIAAAIFISSASSSLAENYDPQHTMLALNMAIVSVNRIITTESRAVLEEEYSNIINNLSLGNIESDREMTELYRYIMNVISSKRLREEEIVYLREEYDGQEHKAIVNAIKSSVTIDAHGNNLWLILGKLAYSCISSYFKYQNEISELRHDMNNDLWQLKREELSECNMLQEKLLQSSWNLLRKYRLSDSYRLTQNDINTFSKAISESNPDKRFRMLRVLEEEFSVYPPYWYYRARAAEEINNDSETRQSYAKFNEVWRPVLRRDLYKLEADKYRIRELLKTDVSKNRQNILNALTDIRRNTQKEDWANNLWAGMMYFALGEKRTGIECVELNVDFEYETEISRVIVGRMKNDTLNLSETVQALTSESDEPEAATETKDSNAWNYYIIAGAGVLIVILLVYVFRPRKTTPKTTPKKTAVLKPDPIVIEAPKAKTEDPINRVIQQEDLVSATREMLLEGLGQKRKCPKCGAVISSKEIVCPSCKEFLPLYESNLKIKQTEQEKQTEQKKQSSQETSSTKTTETKAKTTRNLRIDPDEILLRPEIKPKTEAQSTYVTYARARTTKRKRPRTIRRVISLLLLAALIFGGLYYYFVMRG